MQVNLRRKLLDRDVDWIFTPKTNNRHRELLGNQILHFLPEFQISKSAKSQTELILKKNIHNLPPWQLNSPRQNGRSRPIRSPKCPRSKNRRKTSPQLWSSSNRQKMDPVLVLRLTCLLIPPGMLYRCL